MNLPSSVAADKYPAIPNRPRVKLQELEGRVKFPLGRWSFQACGPWGEHIQNRQKATPRDHEKKQTSSRSKRAQTTRFAGSMVQMGHCFAGSVST